MPLTYGALCALAEKHNLTITENMRAFVRAVEEEDLRAQPPSGPVSLAAEHSGMRVDYSGLLNQARNGLRQEPALAEMLRQLQDHLAELGGRWYAGDAAAVDEFLQLYCIETDKRAIAATKRPHADDAAVDRFAAAMKAKLAQAREKGRGGWQGCDPVELSIMLRAHVEKGDPRDVANFCMFLWNLGKPISDAVLPYGKWAAQSVEQAGAAERVYPDELSDALRHVLGFPNFKCSPFAYLMRDAGVEVKRKAEDEQATVLHWLVKLVLDHGDKWAAVAESELKEMREKAAATQEAAQ
ncbi:hypothetical protein ACQ4P5_20360 [Ralstonia sp. L16]|uniref:hypothetical protein n=1 Tax=Ralstonia sp. L16 TaxID=3423950 RepID=UPI003F7A545C